MNIRKRWCMGALGAVIAAIVLPGSGDIGLSHERVRPPLSRIRTDGRFFVNDAGTFRPVFASALSALARSPEERAAVLDENVALGFNGVRVFAGHLGWANQTPTQARAVLPAFFAEAAQRGLYVYVSALTGGGYDVESHLRDVAALCAIAVNCVLETANEVGHPTQSDTANDIPRLLDMARRVIPAEVPWTLGAPLGVDEPDAAGRYPTDGGEFNDAHLDRGPDKWNQVRRLRAIAAISEATGKPAMSGEPIGAAEAAQPGRRESDPSFFYAMGALCRAFELGCVFHSEDGLNARPLRPNQRRCARAFIAGWRAIGTAERLEFRDIGRPVSPVASADLARVVAAHSFVSGDRGWTVLVGVANDPRLTLRKDWRVRRTVGERPGVRVLELAR